MREPSLRNAQTIPLEPRYSVVGSRRSSSVSPGPSSRGWSGQTPPSTAASASATITATASSTSAASHSRSISGSCADGSYSCLSANAGQQEGSVLLQHLACDHQPLDL